MAFSLLNLLLVLLVAWGAGLLARRLGYPSVLGELIAGILLGPPLLGWLAASEALAVLAEAGILLMMLYIGMEIDPKDLKKASKGGVLAAAGGFITPFVLCYGLIVWAGGTPMMAAFVGIAAGVTSLATKSRILVDLDLLDTRIAHVMMAGALVADTVSLIIFAALLGLAEAGGISAAGLALVAGKAVLFFAVALATGRFVLPHLGRLVQWLGLGRTGTFTLILLVTFGFAEGAELAGMHGILGAFVAGLFLREIGLGRSAERDLVTVIRDASLGFLAPIFFVTAGFAVSLEVFSTSLGLLAGVIVLATIGKIVGTALFYLPTKNGWREGITIGAGMNGRGAVEIIVAQIGLSMGLITAEIFSILVFMALFTTATVPVFLKWGVDWLRRKGELVRAVPPREGTLIIGAGPTARAIAEVLLRSQPVTLIDVNQHQVELARGAGLEALQGSALDEQVLTDAGAGRVRHLLLLTPNAEVNALAARLARTAFQVPEIHIWHDGSSSEGHEALLAHTGGTTLFAGPLSLTEWNYRVAHDEYERTGLALEETRPPKAVFAEVQAERERLPLAVARGDQYLPFHSGFAFQPDDRLILLQAPTTPREAYDRFDRLVARCPVLDLEAVPSLDAFFDIVAPPLAAELNIAPDELAARLHEREAMSSTVVLPGLAVPHVVIDGEDQFALALVRCREGVPFPDHPETVHTLFVLAGSADDRNFHLRVLSAIAQIVQRPGFERDWLTARDAQALRRLVLQAERRRLTPEG